MISRITLCSALLLTISTLVCMVNAAQVTFHVIAPTKDAKNVTVVVGGTTVPLNASNPAVPLYTGSGELPDGATYNYVVDGTPEAINRTFPAGRTETYNDMFNRSVTVQDLPPFPWPLQDEGIDSAQWPRAAPRIPLFDDSYIPTLWFTDGASDSAAAAASGVTMYVILKDQVVEIPNTNLREYKGDSWKTGYTFNFTQGAEKFGGRNQFKLRAGEFDPTQLREKSYTDIMNALGVPVASQIHVRAYSKGEPLGLYILTDLYSSVPEGQRNFGFVEFENGDPAKLERVGVALDCGTGATFEYKSDNAADYNACYGGDMWRSDAAMVQLTKTLAATDGNNTATQDALEKILDVDTVLRQMVMEYLTINWDGYWSQSSNFVMYYDEFGAQKWYFSDQDFDQTFGNGNEDADAPPASYKNFPAKGPNVPGGTRPLIEKLLAVPKWRTRFEFILTQTVMHTFNPVAFNRRIDAFVQVIRPEVQWDHSFKEDTGRYFYFDDFDRGLTESTAYRIPLANGTGVGWGLKTFVEARASGVAREFNFVWDATARDPPAATPTPPPVNGGGPNSGTTTPVGSSQGRSSASSLMVVNGAGALALVTASASILFGMFAF